jgi:hypothetical protein
MEDERSASLASRYGYSPDKYRSCYVKETDEAGTGNIHQGQINMATPSLNTHKKSAMTLGHET